MKVLITFLFLGFCLFGLASTATEEVEPVMFDKTTYKITCHSSRKTIKCCSIERKNDEGGWDTKLSWQGKEKTNSGNCISAGDDYAKMVTEYNTMTGVCMATLTSNTDTGTNASEWRILIRYEQGKNNDGTSLVVSADECTFKTYPKTCTPRQYFEDKKNVRYLKNYTPMPSQKPYWNQARKEKCETLQNCFGHISHDGKFIAIENVHAQYFCQKSNSLVVQKGNENLILYLNNEDYCKQEAPKAQTEEGHGWIPSVEYFDATSKDDCSSQTDLDGYYSWSVKLRKCGVLNDKGDKSYFCKLSESDFITYSKRKEYEDKRCKEIGSSFILFRFLT